MATTQSEDGSTISSFKSTSSSSSSSTMMSSGGGAMPSMGSMGSMGGMGGMSLMGGGSNMDDMMSKMMSNMGSMQMGSSSSKMSSSSVSSFSSSSSSSSMMSSNMSSMLGGGSGGMSLPPMRGMEMPAAASTPAPASETPYTVTSPMSPRTHKVGASEDYKAPSATDSDTSVLLQYKEGSDYKLALNMQQYSPDDITIKLNGRTLTIEATGHGEQFKQKHVIPDNIDLDAMSSSFSSDGVLVIKAPKMK